MSNNPHIVVFKLKELIYTGIFLVLGILLVILFINMFNSGKNDKPSASPGEVNVLAENPITTDEITDTNKNKDKLASSSEDLEDENCTTSVSKTENTTTYTPGVYTSSLILNNSSLEIEVCVDVNKINSISIKNMDESITTMYPLMENSMNDLSNQIINSQSLENITYTDDCKYTYMILLDAISTTLDKAIVK